MSKSGKTHFFLQGGKQRIDLKKGLSRRGSLGKNVAQKMIAMRLSGKSQAECEEWLENIIQEIEQAEKETENG